jgi:hypothetical protein
MSGTAKALCHVPVPERESPEAIMSAAACCGLGLEGKLTLPPCPMVVVDVDVDVVGGAVGVVVGVVDGDA